MTDKFLSLHQRTLSFYDTILRGKLKKQILIVLETNWHNVYSEIYFNFFFCEKSNFEKFINTTAHKFKLHSLSLVHF